MLDRFNSRRNYKDQSTKTKDLRFSGGCVERVTPVPIPNTEVKPLGADGTARATAWESRKPPGLLNEKPAREISRAFPLTTFLSAISNFLHPLRLHVTKSRRNLRRGLSGSIPSLPLGVLYLSPVSRALYLVVRYPALKCWAIFRRPLRGRIRPPSRSGDFAHPSGPNVTCLRLRYRQDRHQCEGSRVHPTTRSRSS